jgi:hypothetical protein
MSDDVSGSSVEVTVAVGEDDPAKLDEIVERLARAGLRDAQPQPAIGVITGTVDGPGAVSALEQVEGVAAVEVAGGFQLPPPDSPIQ